MNNNDKKSLIHFLDYNLNQISLHVSNGFVILNNRTLTPTEAKAMAYALLDLAKIADYNCKRGI